jgi:hypothetical protein
MEVERDHVLGDPKTGFDDDLLERAQRNETASDELEPRFEALSATAELDQVIFDGASFGTPVGAGTPEEEEYLGLPGLLTADQVAALLARRQAEQLSAEVKRRKASAASGDPSEAGTPARLKSATERRILLRKHLNNLVAAHHHRTAIPHGKIHAELRRLCGGPPSAQATIEQLEARIAAIQTLYLTRTRSWRLFSATALSSHQDPGKRQQKQKGRPHTRASLTSAFELYVRNCVTSPEAQRQAT